MNKGFVLSFSAVLLIIVLVMFAVFYSGKNIREEQNILGMYSIEKAGFVADDIESDFNRLLETSVDVNKGVSFTELRFRDKLPADINKMQLIDLKNFIDGNYSVQQNASINLDINKLIDGNTELRFSNNLQYDYNYGVVNSVFFRNYLGDTNIISYVIDININDTSIAVIPWTWNPAGDINVTLRFTDYNVSNKVSYTGILESGVENIYQWNYSGIAGDSFYIRVGGLETNKKALQLINSIDDPNSVAVIDFNALMPTSSGNLIWYYDADLNYVQSDVSVNRKIELGRA